MNILKNAHILNGTFSKKIPFMKTLPNVSEHWIPLGRIWLSNILQNQSAAI